MIKKILYIVRKDCYKIMGGDTIQIEKTKFYLNKKYHITVDIFEENKIHNLLIDDYDIIHIWGIKSEKDIHSLLQKAKSKKIGTITSTIYWNLEDTYFINTFYYFIWSDSKILQLLKNTFIYVTI